MNCKTTKIRKYTSLITLILGVILAVCAKAFSSTLTFPIDYLYGIAVGLIAVSVIGFIYTTIRQHNDQLRQKDQVNEQDERNQLISMRGAIVAYNCVYYTLIVCFLINLFIPLSVHYVSFALIILGAVAQLGASAYYAKKY